MDSVKQYPQAVMKLQGKQDKVRHADNACLAHTMRLRKWGGAGERNL